MNYGDSSLAGTFLAGGSSQTASIGAAVIAAHRQLVTDLLKLAGKQSPLHGLSVDEVGSLNRGLCKLDEPARCESYQAILRRANQDQLTAEASASAPLEIMHWSMHSFGAMFAEVRVNAITGEVRVSRFLGSFDCGRISTPKLQRASFAVGSSWGSGWR